MLQATLQWSSTHTQHHTVYEKLCSTASCQLADPMLCRQFAELESHVCMQDGQEPLQLHSAGQAGAPDAYADADGVNRISDFEKTVEEPVPGVHILQNVALILGMDACLCCPSPKQPGDLKHHSRCASCRLVNNAGEK